MTLNELKVQLESLKDVDFLKEEALKYLIEHSSVGDEGLERDECDKIDGIDYDKVPVDQVSESADEKLMLELEQVQQDTEEVLGQVVQHRRAFPGMAANKLVSSIANIREQHTPKGPRQDADEAPELQNIVEVDQVLLGRLSSGVERAVKLEQDIPKTIAKLERARTVLAEEGGKRVNRVKLNGPWALAVGGSVGESSANLNELLSRHRRTSHQFDLAHKLSAANQYD